MTAWRTTASKALRPSVGRAIRDTALFLLGMVLAVHEFFANSGDREAHLVFCATLLGLPSFFRWDEKRHPKQKDSE